MTKPVLLVPRGSRLPESWQRTTPPRPWVSAPTQVASLPHQHPEKAYAVMSEAGGVPFIIPGFGEIYTEELLEIAERYRERENALAPERASQKAAREHAWRQTLADYGARKIERARRGDRSAPRSDEKRFD